MKLHGPLSSLQASGNVGPFSFAQGKETRQFAYATQKHKDAETATQLLTRSCLIKAVSFWQKYLSYDAPAGAYRRSAKAKRLSLPPYQLAVSQIAKTLQEADPPLSAFHVLSYPYRQVCFTLADPVTGTSPSTTQPITLWTGDAPDAMSPFGELWNERELLITPPLRDANQTIFVQLEKNRLLRSGLYAIALTEAGNMPTTHFDDVHVHGNLTVDGSAPGGGGYTPMPILPSVDFVTPVLIADGLTHELDIASLVPVGTNALSLIVVAYAQGAGIQAYFTNSPDPSPYMGVWMVSSVAWASYVSSGIVKVGVTRKMNYVIHPNFSWLGVKLQGYFT
jgi:hypothetical protein